MTTHCDAVVTYRATDFGFEPIYCSQVVGVRTYEAGDGPVAYCAMTGHRESVERRFGKDTTQRQVCVECGGPVARRNASRCGNCWNKNRPTVALDARFWAKVDKRQDEECWPWTGSTSRGYGYISSADATTILPAHRVSWELANEATIPDGLCVLHRCDNPVCVNPAHLWLGTIADNNRDMFAKGRGWQQVHPEQLPRGEQHHNSVLTDIEVREIRERHALGETNQSQLAREFGVARSTIQRIVKRQVRNEVPA